MSARDLGLSVTPEPPLAASGSDPLRRLFIDRTTALGYRIVAVAEPVQHSVQGYLTAAAGLAAFEETAVVAMDNGVDRGLLEAFAAANAAVLATNRSLLPRQRVYAGITAAVIAGGETTIGLVPPGQALLVQDRRVYGVPDLATWRPGFMPAAGGAEGSDPLGWSPAVQPVLRRTTVGRFDQLLLGASAVGRVLAGHELTELADASSAAVIATVEQALAKAKIDDAYAALVTFDSGATARSSSPDRLAEIERSWHAQPAPVRPATNSVAPDAATEADRRAFRRDALHNRLIDWSERVLGRDDTEPLPLERRARVAAPVGTASLDRYTPTRFGALQPLRSRLPRGPQLPISRRALTLLLVLALAVGAAATVYDVQRAQADRQDRQIETVKREIELGATASSVDEADQHFVRAEHALDRALGHGAKPEMIRQWRAALTSAQDSRHGIARLTNLTQVGQLPASLGGQPARLLVSGDHLYLVAGSVYEVDPAGRELLPILRAGEAIDGRTVGTVLDATVDSGRLVATDGRTLFAVDARGRWTASPLADANRPGGWRAAACGAFHGAFYLLDTEGGQIRRFAAKSYDEAPAAWLKEDVDNVMASAVDMVVDGSIHLLMADGTVRTFYKGQAHGEPKQVAGGEGVTPVALYGGVDVADLYVLERDADGGRLVRYDTKRQQASLYLAPAADSDGYDPASSAAFATARDFVVVEETGVVYFVTDSGLWRAELA